MKRLNKFEQKVALIIGLLTTLIFLFIYLNTFTHPRVMQLNVVGGIESASIKNQQIRVDFNRPIKKETVAENISIAPTFKFRQIWSANTLILIPETTLDSDTEYTVKITKNIKDIYNESFIEDYESKFKTEIPRFAVIEKHPDNDLNTIATYKADLSNRQELITRKNIKYYGLNTNFVVVVTENNYSNNIEILNRKTNQIQNFNLNNIRINTFDLSPSLNKNEFAYTKQSIEIKNSYYLPKSNSEIFIYNLDTQSEVKFNPHNTADDVASLEYSSDGNTLLYKTGESFYSMADTSDQSNYTNIGTFLSEGNFNKDSNSIVFVSYDPLSVYESSQFLSVYDSNRQTTNINNNDIPVLDPQFMHKTDQIIYAEKNLDLETTKGIYKITQTDINGSKKDIIASDKYSLELPKLSDDDRYIAIEQYTQADLKDFKNTRSLGFQNKPNNATVIIFDTKTQKLLNTGISGISVKWF